MRLLTLAMVLATMVMMIGGCARQASQAEPPVSVQPEEPPQAETSAATEAGKGISWLTSLEEGMAAAKQQNKPVIVDFWATWCGPCKTMEEATWPDPQVIAASANYIMVKQEVDTNQESANKYKVDGVPTLLFLSPGGEETHRQVGAISASQLTELMKKYATADK